MNNPLNWISTGAAGLGLGAIFYGGLWWTVRRGVTARQPALWFISSFVVRTGVVATGFYVVGQGHWPRLVSCLIGFMLARMIVLIATSKSEARRAP